MRTPQKSHLKNRSVTHTDRNSQDKSRFCQKNTEKVEIISRTPAEVRPSDFSLRFLT